MTTEHDKDLVRALLQGMTLGVLLCSLIAMAMIHLFRDDMCSKVKQPVDAVSQSSFEKP